MCEASANREASGHASGEVHESSIRPKIMLGLAFRFMLRLVDRLVLRRGQRLNRQVPVQI